MGAVVYSASLAELLFRKLVVFHNFSAKQTIKQEKRKSENEMACGD